MPESRPTAPANLQTLVAECLDLLEAEGQGAVDRLCAAHPEHAAALQQRLKALGALGLLDDSSPGPAALPASIGPFKILRLLGRGGMGVVFEAEQDNPKRRVALKVLRSGLDNADLRVRFAHEAEMLGRLHHPGIAQVHAAGSAPVGDDRLPYFALELIDGPPLTEFARQRQLDTKGRVDLLIKVCEAVHHAHQQGIIHRDLKPSNILVDGSGQPKVLDFGVARAVDPDSALTFRTNIGQLIGTLAYMSPEQANADPASIDTRSDVYSLGVIAYELLAGSLPYDLEGLRLTKAVQVIQHSEPTRLGTQNRNLRGDLDTIVATAMAKEKARRYASAHDLATDLGRYLRHEPIVARPLTTWYQLRKFARRNRILVAGMASVVLALAAGLIGTLIGLVREREQRQAALLAQAEAETRLAQADAVLSFQRRMLSAVKPDEDGRDVRVVDVLDRASRELDGAYLNQPAVEALVRRTIGETFDSLGLADEALPQLERGLDLARQALGPGARDTVHAQLMLANHLATRGQYDKARPLIEAALANARATHGEDSELVAEARGAEANLLLLTGEEVAAEATFRSLLDQAIPSHAVDRRFKLRRGLAAALVEQGRHAESIDLMQQVRAEQEQRFGARHPRTLDAVQGLIIALQEGGRPRDSLDLAAQTYELQRTTLGEDHPSTLAAAVQVGGCAVMLGDYERAEQVLGSARALAQIKLGPSHPTTLTIRIGYGQALTNSGKLQDAESELRSLVDALVTVRGPEHRTTLAAHNNLAIVLNRSGRPQEAAAIYEQLLAARRRVLDRGHVDTLVTLHNLGTCYWKQKLFEQADPYFRESVDEGRKSLAQDNYLMGLLLHGLGKNLTRMQRWEEAEDALLEGYAWLERTIGATSRVTRDLASDVRFLYQAWGKPDQAAAWNERADGIPAK